MDDGKRRPTRRRLGLLGLIASILIMGALALGIVHPTQQAERGTLAAPSIPEDLPSLGRWKSFELYKSPVPVLLFHGITDRQDSLSITQAQFATQMEALHRGGFHTIDLRQFLDFLDGRLARLPSNPILLTFDDGRLDSYQGADKVLARYGFQAVMFVTASWVNSDSPFYLKWAELRKMQESGRWMIQLHAGHGHTTVTTPDGGRGEYYAYVAKGETFAGYRRRIISDISWGEAQLRRHLPGYAPIAFAVPYSNYGQRATNDLRVPSFFISQAHEHFPLVFDGDYLDKDVPRGRIAPELIYRMRITSQTSLNTLNCRLAAAIHDEPIAKERFCLYPRRDTGTGSAD